MLVVTIPDALLKAHSLLPSGRPRPRSRWADTPLAPPDSIFGLIEAFGKDPSPHKVNLSVGAYRDDDTRPYVLPCVLKAEKKIAAAKMDKEYSPIAGSEKFCRAAVEFALGKDSPALKGGLNVTVQSLSGTGALSLFGAFAKKFFPGDKTIYLPQPTWGNHGNVFRQAGFTIKTYRYYDGKRHCLDYDGLLSSLCELPDCSMVLFHGCAHNPSGCDPSREQWCELSQLTREKQFFTVFDLAYQGFATGDPVGDAFAIRQFAEDGNRFALCQSFAKNMSLYGERIGALTVLADGNEEISKITSQLKAIARATYSNPPIHGARLATEVMTDPQLCGEWYTQMKGMSERMRSIRKRLRDELKREGSKRDWEHLVKQIGMFCLTGLSVEQVDRMTKDFHIYMMKDGRISVAGVSSKNVEYVACALHQVTK